MREAPEGRCGYTWPEDHDVDDQPNHQSCCWRGSVRDSGRCVWHADPGDVGPKPIGALRHTLVDAEAREQTHPGGELLDGAVLAGVEFNTGFSMDGFYLRDADLSDTKLSLVSLTGAQLSGADLNHANLRDADLSHALLKNTDLTHTMLGDADLSHTKLQNADLSHTVSWDADFSQAILIGADFQDATLSGSEFTSAALPGSDFTEAHLSGVDFTNGYLRDANLTNAYLWNATLTDANLRDANLTGTDFHDTDLSGANFTDASLRWAVLRDTTAIHTNFTDSSLLGADIEGASLKDSQFDGANLTGARLYDTKPQGVSINDQTVFSKQTVYEREADPCDLWHPLNGDRTTPTSLPNKFALAVRSGQVLQSRFRSADASPPSVSISKVKQAVKRFRRHLNLDTEEQRAVDERLKKATSVYRIRQRLQRENSRPRDVAEPYVREQHSRRKRAFATRSYWEWFKHATYRWVMLYGESPARVVGTSIAVVAVFAAIYSVVGGIVIGGEEPDLIGNIYFSAVTFSTLGYGGIEPTTTTTQLLASVQSLFGGILIALLVAVFGRRALR